MYNLVPDRKKCSCFFFYNNKSNNLYWLSHNGVHLKTHCFSQVDTPEPKLRWHHILLPLLKAHLSVSSKHAHWDQYVFHLWLGII